MAGVLEMNIPTMYLYPTRKIARLLKILRVGGSFRYVVVADVPFKKHKCEK